MGGSWGREEKWGGGTNHIPGLGGAAREDERHVLAFAVLEVIGGVGAELAGSVGRGGGDGGQGGDGDGLELHGCGCWGGLTASDALKVGGCGVGVGGCCEGKTVVEDDMM